MAIATVPFAEVRTGEQFQTIAPVAMYRKVSEIHRDGEAARYKVIHVVHGTEFNMLVRDDQPVKVWRD